MERPRRRLRGRAAGDRCRRVPLAHRSHLAPQALKSAEDLTDFGRRYDIELRVGARLRRAIGAEMYYSRVVAKAAIEQAFVFDFDDQADAKGNPRHLLFRVPSRLPARHARARLEVGVELTQPVGPRV